MGDGSASASALVVACDDSYLETVTQKRIRLFEEIQAKQALERLNIGGEAIKVTLPDGAVKEGKKWITTPLDIAKEISSGLAASCLIARVDETLWDMARPLEGDCKLQLFKFDSNEGRDTFWHSSAHILGESLERAYGCKLCIGPCTTRGEGFYYDAYYNDLTLNEGHFGTIESQAQKAVAEKQPFERIEVSRAEALEMFAENQFKVEIINELPEDKTITVYRCGPLVDLCHGPHIPNTSFVKAFSCLKASSSYWRGKADRESLQRVYGISFPDSKHLKEYKHLLEEAEKCDNRLLGKAQELFFSHPLSPGEAAWLSSPASPKEQAAAAATAGGEAPRLSSPAAPEEQAADVAGEGTSRSAEEEGDSFEDALTDEQLQEKARNQADDAKAGGNKLFSAGKYEEALLQYEMALQIAVELESAEDIRAACHSNRAVCFLKLGKHDDTIKECTKALELNPSYLKALLRRAEAHEKLEHYDEAIADLKKVIELDPSNQQTTRSLSRLEPLAAEKREKMKEEMIAKLKDLGNSVLGRFGMSVDNFKAVKDPNTGSYSIQFQK